MVLELTGDLDLQALRQALKDTAALHEALRVRFEGSTPVTVTVPPGPVPLLEASDLERAARLDAQTPFDLREGPLFRAVLAPSEPGVHHLLLTAHHAVCDGWSLRPLVRSLLAAYEARREGLTPATASERLSWRVWAALQRARHEGEGSSVLKQAAARLEGHPDLSRAGAPDTFEPRRVSRTLAAHVPAHIASRVQRAGATPLALLVAAFARAIGRHQGQDDVLIATPYANRDLPGLSSVVGYFVDPHHLRLRLDVPDPIADARHHLMVARREGISADALARALRPDLWDRVWAPARFALNALPRLPEPARVAGLSVRARPDRLPDPRFQFFDGMLYVFPDQRGLELVYDAGRLKEADAEQIVDGFIDAVEELSR